MSADFRLSSGAGNAFCMRCPGGQANQYALKSNSLYYSMEAMAAYRYNNLAGTTNQWNFVIGREYPCNGLCAAGTFSTATGVDAAAASCSACTLGTFSLQGALLRRHVGNYCRHVHGSVCGRQIRHRHGRNEQRRCGLH